MKITPFILIIVIGAAVLASDRRAQAEVPEVRISVDGVGCPFCVYGLEKKLKQVVGVEAVEVELKTGLARVTLEGQDSPPDVAAFQRAVKKAGFTPRGIQIVAIGRIQVEGDEMRLRLRGSGEEYLLFAKDSANTALPPELKAQLSGLAKNQSLVAVTGTPHHHAQDAHGLSVETVAPVERVALSVEGMACEQCVARLTGLFEKREGVYQASVSLAEKRAVVESIGNTLNADELIGVAEDAGFTAAVEDNPTER